MLNKNVYDKIAELLKKGRLFVCISGASCSGKSTMAREIKNSFSEHSPLILCEDSWYKDLYEIPRNIQGYYDMECEKAFCIDEYKSDVDKLRRTGVCNVPTYNLELNKREHKLNKVEISDLVILEGLHTIDVFKSLYSVENVLYIFLDINEDVCASRRVDRDTTFLDIPGDRINYHYHHVTMPNYRQWYNLQKSLMIKFGNNAIVLSV